MRSRYSRNERLHPWEGLQPSRIWYVQKQAKLNSRRLQVKQKPKCCATSLSNKKSTNFCNRNRYTKWVLCYSYHRLGHSNGQQMHRLKTLPLWGIFSSTDRLQVMDRKALSTNMFSVSNSMVESITVCHVSTMANGTSSFQSHFFFFLIIAPNLIEVAQLLPCHICISNHELMMVVNWFQCCLPWAFPILLLQV